MKKTLTAILTAAMLISLVPATTATADEAKTVEGLTMTSYTMVAKTAAWDDAYKRVMMQDDKGYQCSFDDNKMFDSTIDELVYWSYKAGTDSSADFGKFNGDYYKSFGAPYQGDNNYLIHWTGTVSVEKDTTFTVVANKLDNGFVLEFDGVRAFEYWGTAYFDSDEDKLPSDIGEITLTKGTHTVNAWFLELTGGEACDVGAYLPDSTEYKSFADLGLTFDLAADVYHTDLDRWGDVNHDGHPYTKAFIDAGQKKGTGDGGQYNGGNGAQCIEDNWMYDATIDALLAASKKAGTTIVPRVDYVHLGIADESYINMYEGFITVDKTGYYLFGAEKVDNGFVIDIVDGNKTYRAFEMWANGTWNDNGSGCFMPEDHKVYLEAGKTYGFRAAFLELDGGQILWPRVKYSEDGNGIANAEAQEMNGVLNYTTTVPADIDAVDPSVLDTEGTVLLNGLVENVATSLSGLWEADGPISNIFDNNKETKFGCSDKRNGQITWTTKEPTTITNYKIVAANDNNENPRTPLGWTLEGSNDGVIYTLIDHVDRGAAGIAMTDFAEAVYSVDNPAEYTYYRLRFVGNWDGTGGGRDGNAALSFADLNLYNVPESVTPPPTDNPDTPDTPDVPQTGSAVVALAAAGAIALAGAIVVSKKRKNG
ncbi:MAG: NPXTG-anchored protein [Eubacteriales bacterium]